MSILIPIYNITPIITALLSHSDNERKTVAFRRRLYFNLCNTKDSRVQGVKGSSKYSYNFKEMAMKDFIEELKDEHVRLIHAFEEVKRAADDPETRDTAVMRLRDILISHLKRENERLYPQLYNRFQGEKEKKDIVESFMAIEDVLPRIDNILRAYVDGRENNGISLSDLNNRLYEEFKVRLKREEDYLFPLLQG